MHAEQTYMFRHALLREAAYQLQLPSVRAAMHEAALDILEAWLDAQPDVQLRNSHAAELAEHARLANPGSANPELASRELRHLLAAAPFAARGHDQSRAAEHWRRIGCHRLAAREQRADALVKAGRILHEQARSEEAAPIFNEALELARQAGLCSTEAAALESMGDLMRDTGRVGLALENYSRGVSVAEAGGERPPPSLLAKISLVSDRASDIERAADAYRRAMDEAGDGSIEKARCQVALASMLRRLKRLPEALELTRAGVEVLRGGANPILLSGALNGLANSLMDLGRFEEAQRAYEHCVQIAQQAGVPRTALLSQSNLAILHRWAGQLDQAEHSLRGVIEGLREIGDARGEAINRRMLGLLLLEQGKYEPAQTELESALEVARLGSARLIEARTLEHLARCREALQGFGASLQSFKAAYEFNLQHGDEASKAATALGLAIALTAQGQDQEADALWQQALPVALQREGQQFVSHCELRRKRARESAASRAPQTAKDTRSRVSFD